MAKMGKGGFSHATIEEMKFLIKKPWAEVRQEKKWGVDYPGDKNVKAAMERHPAMLWENQPDGCLACQNGTAQNPQTRWRCNGTGTPPPERPRDPTPEQSPHPPERPLLPPSSNEAAHVSEIEGVLPGYVYIHTSLPSAQCFNLDECANNCKRDKDFNPD